MRQAPPLPLLPPNQDQLKSHTQTDAIQDVCAGEITFPVFGIQQLLQSEQQNKRKGEKRIQNQEGTIKFDCHGAG